MLQSDRPLGQVQSALRRMNYMFMHEQHMLFIQSMAVMLGAGITVIDALRTFQLESRSRAMRTMVKAMTIAVENGSPLWRAMQDACFFSTYEIALVRIGEEAGTLPRNMEYLQVQQEKIHALRQKIQLAMLYPSIVLVLAVTVVVGLSIFVLPSLIRVLVALNVTLPLTTRLLISMSDFFVEYVSTAVPVTILTLVTFFVLAAFTPFKIITQWIVFHLPGIGRLAQEVMIARFGLILGGLLTAGVPLPESIASLTEATDIIRYRKLYEAIHERVLAGESFRHLFEHMGPRAALLPLSVRQLVMTGEHAGTLPEILLKIADVYERKAADTAQKLPVILEPSLLIMLGVVVLIVAMGVIAPIYSIVANFPN